MKKTISVLLVIVSVFLFCGFSAAAADSVDRIDFTVRSDIAGYTYGPLLGLYTFGLFVKNRKVFDKAVPFIAVASPIISYLMKQYSPQLFGGYKIGFEILIINGLLTFVALLAFSKKEKTA